MLNESGTFFMPNSFFSAKGQSHFERTGDEELAAFLKDEIENEKNAGRTFNTATLDGFECEYSEAEVTLTKKFNNEIIKIKENVNDSVQTDDSIMDPNDTSKGNHRMLRNFAFFNYLGLCVC
ncbi:hypothetical protein TNIN_213191 [Trichonephila inaurata madagascariensis]|uniref:Uncharacterized protein n=1 Tax=Trichonephila inaurata madagascariensis TaxID=2747483 RepID=A0A8X7BPB7_9ARAC|nr:hypothetical protein TNIN_213191 [Trichonephila inaurata madagascariensis]